MKKVILSVSFLVITLFFSLPAFADSFWNYTGTANAKGVLKDMKATVTLNYDELGSGPQTPVKYSINYLAFNLSDDASSFVDTDISISGTAGPSGPAFSLAGGMQGGALPVLKAHTYTVTASFNPAETAPFSFTDLTNVMTGDGLVTSIAEGTLVESFNKTGDQNKAKINMTFRFVGKLDGSNDPALITVTLVGTVSKTP